MPNITDLLSTLHDSLVALLKPSPATAMQMNWPGISLSPSDFKPQSNPAGPYDPQVAEETVSGIADLIPGVNELNFENSGFEVHNVYEALIFGATVKGATLDAPSPLSKLFQDAQFEFVRAEKGSIQDPQAFYYPVKATPVDWYNESSPNWTQFNLNQAEVKPATSASRFLKSGGQQLIDRGVLRVTAAPVPAVKLSSQLQTAVLAKLASSKSTIKISSKPVGGMGAAATTAPPALRTQIMANAGGSAADPNKLKSALNTLNASTTFKKNIQLTPQLATIKMPDATMIDATKLTILPSAKFSIGQRANLNQLIVHTLPTAPNPATSDGWKLSFRYCLVRLNRNWFNNTVLNLPGWYFPGAKAGYFSAGEAGANPPSFPMLTQAFLAIRDLRISANWTPQDLNNISRAASFGPFDLRSKVMNANEIRVDGLQIVAWLSTRNAALAPINDPALP